MLCVPIRRAWADKSDVCERERERECVCVCVCVCERERERDFIVLELYGVG